MVLTRTLSIKKNPITAEAKKQITELTRYINTYQNLYTKELLHYNITQKPEHLETARIFKSLHNDFKKERESLLQQYDWLFTKTETAKVNNGKANYLDSMGSLA